MILISCALKPRVAQSLLSIAPCTHCPQHPRNGAGGKTLLWEPKPMCNPCVTAAAKGGHALDACAAAQGAEQCGFEPRRV